MSEWEHIALGDIISFRSGKNAPKDQRTDDGPFRMLGANGHIGFTADFLHEGPFLTVGRVGAYGAVNRVGDERCWVSDNALIARPDLARASVEFTGYLLETVDYDSIKSGTTQPLITQTGLKKIRKALPPPAEQRRIVDVMAAVDSQVASVSVETEALRNMFALRKAALFDGFKSGGVAVRLSDVLEEIKRPVAVDKGAQYRQIGIRSHGRGVFTKDGVSGEELGSKKVFWLEPGDLVINIVFAWEGAVAVMPVGLDGYCASHRFPAYRRTDGGDVDFFRFFFSTSDGARLLGDCSPGGAGRNRTLNRRRLLDSIIHLPSAATQTAAVAEFRSFETALTDLETELARLRMFRSALLASLLNRDVEIPESYDVLLEAAS